MKTKNIIFDFGGVLVDWNPRYLYRDIFNDDEKMEWFLTNVCTDEWNIQQDAGRSLNEATEGLVQQHPDQERLIRMFYGKWKTMLKGDIPENSRLVKVLKDAGYPIYGLTNWSGETWPYAYNRFKFFHEFDGIVVSGDEKMAKPERPIYDLILSRYRLKAEESLFMDDNANNIRTAKELGFQTIHITPDLNLEQELIKMRVLKSPV